ncbi:hypothetical protein M9Y10_018969 [Tritrichomonas musculus]|uniref:F5/8 type C domain-containing protein n=1 Tax=Tritrichomonas musculus TaxID=1915356 RepID=A0ABR2HI88_9EUKA
MNTKLIIPQDEDQNMLTIIYKEKESNVYELKVSKFDLLKNLQYFYKKRYEIDSTNLIYIQENIKFDIFKNFISSMKTKEIMINDDNFQEYKYLSNKYEYDSLAKVINQYEDNQPDVQSIISNLQNNDSIDYQKEEIMSKNLDICLSSENFKKMPLSLINRILNSPKRIIKNHHLLVSFVIDLIKEYSNKKIALEEKENIHILPKSLDYCLMTSEEIENLFEIENSLDFFSPQNSQEKIKKMIEDEKSNRQLISELMVKFDDLEKRYNDELKKLEEELANTKNEFIKKHEEEEKRIQQLEDYQAKVDKKQDKNLIDIDSNCKIQYFEYDDDNKSNALNGIIRNLTNLTGGNVSDNGCVIATASTEYASNWRARNAVDLDKDNYFCSNSIPNSWILYDFVDKKVQPTYYTIKSEPTRPDYAHLSTWLVEGSNTAYDNDWKILDSRKGVTSLNGKSIVCTFKIQTKLEKNEYFRYLRIKQTGPSICNNHYMTMSALEYFGNLLLPDK